MLLIYQVATGLHLALPYIVLPLAVLLNVLGLIAHLERGRCGTFHLVSGLNLVNGLLLVDGKCSLRVHRLVQEALGQQNLGRLRLRSLVVGPIPSHRGVAWVLPLLGLKRLI